ncbi:MAG: G-D-S-L family lipolytic protein [Bacteroidota bacterium]
MKQFFRPLVAVGLLFVVVSCSDDDDVVVDNTPVLDPVVVTSGTADFSTYVALGNSLTAGYSDNALFTAGQENSFPNMLAGQFALAGGGDFDIPFMADNLGGMSLGGQVVAGNRLILSFASGSPAPVVKDTVTFATDVAQTLTGSFNNMGVPGAKSFHLRVPGYGNVAGVATGQANPYFVRFASNPNATILEDAVAQNPTFFSLWIGNNDVLAYVVDGGAGADQTGNLDAATYGGSDISDPMVVAGSIQEILTQLTANGAKGVVANLPDVGTIPFVNTVPFAPLSPANPEFAAQIPTINAQLAGLNQAFDALQVPERKIVYSETEASPVLIFDEDIPDLSTALFQVLQLGGLDEATAFVLSTIYGQCRPATAADKLVLTSQTIIAQTNQEALAFLLGLGVPQELAESASVNGITWPLEDKWVLTPQEQAIANTALNAYNELIEGLATTFDVAFVDANTLLSTVNDTGITLSDGSVVTGTFATGGGFSLDGVHPSPRGYAILANAFAEAINAKYGATLPGVDPTDFTGLYID